MKKKWKKIIAAWCAATMFMTMPGTSALADELADEAIITVAEDSYPIVDVVDSLNEEDTDIEVPAEEVSDEEDVAIEAETVDLENPEEIVGVKTVTVGDGVTATFDENTGTVGFYSDGGELWENWADKIGIERELITSIKVKSGTVYLPADSSFLFEGLFNLKDFDATNFNTTKVTDMQYMFSNCINIKELDLSNFDTTNVTNMTCMFDYCPNLSNINLSRFNTSNVTDMRSMFRCCSSLTSLNLSSFDTSNVVSMHSMFSGFSSLTNLDLSSFNTSNVRNMDDMFRGCSLTNLDLSSFNTSNVRSMKYMFSGCSSLTNLNLSSFDTAKVTTMACMFNGCSSLTNLDLSSFNTSNVKYMEYMFNACSNLINLDLSNFDTSHVEEFITTDYSGHKMWPAMYNAFYGCESLQLLKTPKKQIKSGVTLPDTMYDSTGASYTELPIMSKSIVLTKGHSILNYSMTLSPTSYTYDGKSKKPAVTVNNGTTTLTNNTDYTVEYSNNINAGTATVTVTGKGNYVGTIAKTFTIAKAAPTLIFASTSLSKKTGDAAFTNALTKTTDGAVTFKSNNTVAATVNSTSGEVTIKGAGTATITANAAEGTNYKSGSASYTLTVTASKTDISGCTISLSSSSYTYNGKARKPSVTVTNGTATLTDDTDYTVSYSNNTNAGTATVTITGKGDYTGTNSKSFTINKATAKLTFANASIAKTTNDAAFTNELTKTTDGTVTFKSSNTGVATVNSTNGLVTIKGAGTTTITATASAGTNYKAGSASYTLTVTAPSPAGFSDVQDPSHPYYKAIYWAAEAGITKGYPDGTFGIDKACTRSEAVMFLWRLAGKPAPVDALSIPFKDVPKSHAHYKAILWASQKGITKGYSDGTFGINKACTRGQIMTFIWRFKGQPAPKAAAKSPFSDVPKNHAYYKAILWGSQNKITNGFSDGTFGIDKNCTRGQIVTFLYRAK